LKIPGRYHRLRSGAGQFEINLLHVPDALLAADQATMFKRIVKGARKNTALMRLSWRSPMVIAPGTACIFTSASSTAMEKTFSRQRRQGICGAANTPSAAF
jgi:hypothetical protein